MTRNEARPRSGGARAARGLFEQPGQAVRVQSTRLPASPSTPRKSKRNQSHCAEQQPFQYAELLELHRREDQGLAKLSIGGHIVTVRLQAFNDADESPVWIVPQGFVVPRRLVDLLDRLILLEWRSRCPACGDCRQFDPFNALHPFNCACGSASEAEKLEVAA